MTESAQPVPAHRILLVDDDTDIRRTLAEILEDSGYAVTGAANGRDALAVLQTEKPCIILLDLMMPVMDGYEFLAEQSQQPPLASIPVIVITAGAGVRPGITAPVLSKPIHLEKLMAALRQHCDPSTVTH